MRQSVRTQRKIEFARKLNGVPSNIMFWLGIVYVGTAVSAMILFAFLIALSSYSHLLTLLAANPSFFASSNGALVATASVAGFGLFLFAIREKWLFIYAALEFGAALGFALDACSRLGASQNWMALAAALLGATYVVVRALDNFSKAWKVYRLKASSARSHCQV